MTEKYYNRWYNRYITDDWKQRQTQKKPTKHTYNVTDNPQPWPLEDEPTLRGTIQFQWFYFDILCQYYVTPMRQEQTPE